MDTPQSRPSRDFCIASWNVNSLRVRLPQVLDWLREHPVDCLALQEIKLQDEDFPHAALAEAGYEAVCSGQKTYNGVALLGREGLTEVEIGLPGHEDPQRRLIAATIAGIRVIDVYIPNGEATGSDKYTYKLDWLSRLEAYLRDTLERYPHAICCGDFNIAPEDRDVHDPEAWSGRVLCSGPEREAFERLLATGLVDAFREHCDEAGHYSWWDYRAAAFRRDLGLRIDHILCSRPLARLCRDCHIDKTPRSWPRPSDHAPVVATFALGMEDEHALR